ncbi:MAG: class I SAM-dependent methyltransferase [Pseudomonadales bacterium]
MSNEAQIEYWNGSAGQTWVESQQHLDRLLAPLSDAAIERAAVQCGERVVDIGCGCGATSLTLAEQGGDVWGVDISEPMLALAARRAEGKGNVRFSRADASAQHFSGDHDLLFSRFGVMFFDDPNAAFRNLRSALKDSGRLVFLCWQAAAANGWLSVAGRAVQPFLPQGGPAVSVPGADPFAFADSDFVRGILEQAAFRDIAFTSLTPSLHLADDLEGAMAFQTRVGPLARVLAELEGDTRAKALEAARDAFKPHLGADGIRLPAAAWLVTARAG